MNQYDPKLAPNLGEWLELDEQERTLLVEQQHRFARDKLPNLTAHAIFHMIVENHIALNLEPVVRTMTRLTKEGLTQHDAVHAITSVVAEHIYDLLNTNDGPNTSQTPYNVAVERLNAKN